MNYFCLKFYFLLSENKSLIPVMHMYYLHDFFDWVLSLSLEQVEKNGDQLQNDFTKYFYCFVLDKRISFKMYVKVYFIFKFLMERAYLTQICIDTFLDSLGSAEI